MKNQQQVNFTELVEQVKKPLWGREHLAIWGGTCSEDILLDFIQDWPLEQMPCRIWKYTNRIAFEEQPPTNATLLERGRLFGVGGDLELRRDGNVFRWRFVGKLGIRLPKGYDTDEANFWTDNQEAAFHCYEETALLWGKRSSEGWYDDRVAAADLRYPVDGEPERVQVHYKTFSRAGCIEFVWFTGLSEWKIAATHKQNITTEEVKNDKA